MNGLTAWLLSGVLTNAPNRMSQELEGWAGFPAWAKLVPGLVPESPSERSSAGALASRLLAPDGVVARWIDTVALDDLLNWRAPSALYPSLRKSQRTGDEYVWLVDRFTETYLRDWRTESLHLEYRFAVGVKPGCCSVEELAARNVSYDDLCSVISSRATVAEAGPPPQYGAIQMQAIERLRSGELGVAAALLDAAKTMWPKSADAWNDYAFCLLPEDPEGALLALGRAGELGYDRPVVLRCNEATALMWLGRDRDALTVIETVLLSEDREDAYLWTSERENPQIEATTARDWAVEAGNAVVRRIGSPSVAKDWESKVAVANREA